MSSINKFILSTLLIILSYTISHGQNAEIKKADHLFDQLSFVEAIDIYEKLAEKDINIEHISKKLAQAYMKIGKTDKAEFWYGRVVVQENKKAEDLYQYSQCLKSNGKYKEADVWVNKYVILNEEDSRGEMQRNSSYFTKMLEEEGPNFTIKNLIINSTESEFAPIYYKNGIIFSSNRNKGTFVQNRHSWNAKPFLDLYFFEDTSEINLPKILKFDPKINSKFHEGPSCFSQDGNTIYFTRNNYSNRKKGHGTSGTNNLKIYKSVKKNDKWGEPEEMAFNNDSYSVGHPALSNDGSILYFSSDMPGGIGGTDLYAFNLYGDSTQKAENLGPDINTEGDEMFPFIHQEGFLFFSSNGHEGAGGLDVFVANPNNKFFHKVKNVGLPINGPKDDFSFILDSKQKKGYFSSNREGGKGSDDIYGITVIKPFERGLTLKGTISEINTFWQKKIPHVKILLMDQNNAWIEEIVTNDVGEFSFLVDPEKKYNILASKEGFYADTFKVNTAVGNDKYLLETNLELVKDIGFFLEGNIKTKSSKKPLSGVKISILDNITDQIIFEDTTGKAGEFNVSINKKLNDRISYNIKIEKDGFFTRSLTFNDGLKKQGKVNLNKALNLEMDKIELNKSIKIENIYFDSGKWEIRSDAEKELDNIVQLLIDNPTIEIELGSHTDSRGKSSNNLWLSKKRAASSANYIVSKGIDINRITIKGYGENQPLNKCKDGVKCTDKEHQENRRTEFKVTKL